MSRSRKILFTISLALNVILLGAVGGHVLHILNENPWWEVREDLAPESQNVAARTFQSAYSEIREIGDEARKIRADIMEILAAEKFDERAFDRQIKKLAVTRNKIAAIKVKTTKELAKNLSQDERKKMAERMTRMLGGGWEKPVHRERQPEEMGRNPDERLEPSEKKK